ncbi:hypothetical protein H0H87_000424 [Tephrocybe sp. NHM501043]|nr:hypothetical protein H0H87_000424 [Tephrocybe sp. NHM501043]
MSVCLQDISNYHHQVVHHVPDGTLTHGGIIETEREAVREAIERDLYAAAEKMDKIQAENDLLLDAIYTAAPEVMQLVSPNVYYRPLPPSNFSGPSYHSPPYPKARLSPRPTQPPPMAPAQNHNYSRENDQDHEMGSSPHVIRESPRHEHARVPSSSSVHAAPSLNGHSNGNGVLRLAPELQLQPKPEAKEEVVL